jgi:hypothetical protein
MNLNELILKARADMDEKNAYCQKHFNCNYSECTPAQKSECNQKCGVPKQVTDSSPNAVNILDMDEDGNKKVAKSDEKAYKNMNCMNCSDGTDTDGNACENCYPKKAKLAKAIQEAGDCGWSLIKAQPCSVRGCGAMSTDSPDQCAAGEVPSTCSRRRAESRHAGKQQRRQGGKVRHLEIGDDY